MNTAINEVTIIGLDGKIVLKKVVDGTQTTSCQMDVSGIQPGLYILSVQTGNGTVSKKLNIIR
jgi:hypothetical protein